MKLKITNKWTSEVIELEGTEAELAYFMSNYKPQYNYYPWFNSSIALNNICVHEYTTLGVCQKCGQSQWTLCGNISTSSVTD